MLTKRDIQLIEALKVKKYRQKHGLFIAEGPKVVEELLKAPEMVEKVYHTKEYQPTTQHNFYEEISGRELDKISALKTAHQVLALAKPNKQDLDINTISSQLVLGLESIRDPGNLGTIIRIADWFGIKIILCSEDCVDIYNPKTVQATMGSIFRVHVYYTDLSSILGEIGESMPIYATSLKGDNIYTSPLSKNGVLLVGNEGAGLSEDISGLASHHLHIPSFNEDSDGAESLNAAFACAIACSEFRRR